MRVHVICVPLSEKKKERGEMRDNFKCQNDSTMEERKRDEFVCMNQKAK